MWKLHISTIIEFGSRRPSLTCSRTLNEYIHHVFRVLNQNASAGSGGKRRNTTCQLPVCIVSSGYSEDVYKSFSHQRRNKLNITVLQVSILQILQFSYHQAMERTVSSRASRKCCGARSLAAIVAAVLKTVKLLLVPRGRAFLVLQVGLAGRVQDHYRRGHVRGSCLTRYVLASTLSCGPRIKCQSYQPIAVHFENLYGNEN